MAETRIYKVSQTLGDKTAIRLVEAETPAKAVRHVVKGSVHCEVCSVPDAIKLSGAGAVVETASEGGTMVVGEEE